MFDKQELEQAQYNLVQHYLTRLETYASLYKLKNQAHIAVHQYAKDRAQIDHFSNWAATTNTERGAALYLAMSETGDTLTTDQQSFSRRLDRLETGLDLAQKLEDTRYIALHYYWLGTLHRDLCKYEKAQDYLQQALNLVIELGMQALIISSYRELGVIAKRLGSQQDAWDLTQQALDAARAMKSDYETARCLRNLSTIAYEMGDSEHAIELARESLALLEVIGSPREIAYLAYTIGSLMLLNTNSQLEDARRFLWQSYEAFKLIEYERMVAGAACNIASDLIKNQGDYARGIQLSEEALDIYRNLNYSLGICSALTNLGEAALKQGQLQHARALYCEGLVLAKETQSAWDIIMLSVGMAMVSNQAREFEDAQYYLSEALKIAIDGHMEALALYVFAHLAIPIAHQAKQVELAAEFIGLALAHPMSTSVVVADANLILTQLQQDFSTYDLRPAVERGKRLDLHISSKEILDNMNYHSDSMRPPLHTANP